MELPEVRCHILVYNSGPELGKVIDSVLSQDGFRIGENLFVEVTDNGSSLFPETIKPTYGSKVTWLRNEENLGFAGGNNQAVRRFLNSKGEYLLFLNPDCVLESSALRCLVEAIGSDTTCGSATPLLLRANELLDRCEPQIVDAAGMTMTPSLRHFDRGSGKALNEALLKDGFVFGGTGACLLMKRDCIEDLILSDLPREGDIDEVYPALNRGRNDRSLLWDEAFFAYREDADLAWRSQRAGWQCRYVPKAKGYHRRLVTPERRGSLAPVINKMSVRNRFLLQLQNYHGEGGIRAFLEGILFRNIIVILALFISERSSLGALKELHIFRKRAFERRAYMVKRWGKKLNLTSRWFVGN